MTKKLLTLPSIKLQKSLFLILLLLNLTSCFGQKKNKKPPYSMEKEHKHTNQLVHSDSPYLLQHAHNPVNWYAWTEEALKKALEENKPILVSIGYSACHWCHVMEKESFENEEIAKIMNENFICIKVDKEERPDIDGIYMDAVQQMGVNGGWPLNVFLTSEQKPFYGGTYFPTQKWANILLQIAKAYKSERKKIEDSANLLNERLNLKLEEKFGLSSSSDSVYGIENMKEIANKIYQDVDLDLGGMNRSPKFPMPSIWLFLLEMYEYNKDEKYLEAVEITLKEMAKGGIYDQLEGGFARYSTDKEWFAPHFEKMLYDNGQLLSLYAKAYNITKEPTYKKVISETVRFLEKELSSPEGGFYAALDADSEGEEGKYYVWNYSEVKEILDSELDFQIFEKVYNLKKHGNWEEEKNILHKDKTLNEIAKELNVEPEALEKSIENSNRVLLKKRDKRIKPGLDDKTICSWNALMLKGLADAYAHTGEKKYLELALKNANFIDKNLYKEGRLFRTYKNKKAKIDAFLEDYATLADAYIRLYEVSFEEKWLNKASTLIEYSLANFHDKESIFLDYTNLSLGKLIIKKQEIFDNVIPASNSIFAKSIYKLGIALNRQDYVDFANKMSSSVEKMLDKDAQFLSNWASLKLTQSSQMAQITVVGKNSEKFAKDILSKSIKSPHVLMCNSGNSDLDIFKDKKSLDNKTMAYVCFGNACYPPFSEVDALVEFLNK